MLDPHRRQLYTDALKPPPGYTFDYGVATTFTLDLTTLLTIPLHLTLFSGDRTTEELLEDPVHLLESLRRTTERLEVYCQQGMIAVPTGAFALYSMLEPVVREVRPPVAGIFHPKLWVLRFVEESTKRPRLRLLVLTRNLTQDRSWDLSLQLEGEIGGRARKDNRPLARLVERLPEMARPSRQPGKTHADLVQEVRRAKWEAPEPFREVRFHVLGLDRGKWDPPTSDEALIVSPFVSNGGISRVTGATNHAVGLVSRMEELARLDPATLEPFDQVLHLHPDTGNEDPEESDDLLGVLTGLHAKAYVLKQGWNTHLFVGSANATDAGMRGANVEILAELVGRWSQVGKPSDVLKDESGLMKYLDRFEEPEEDLGKTEEEKRAESALNAVRSSLIKADLRVRCLEREGEWAMSLEPTRVLRWEGLKRVRAWPITLQSGSAARGVPREWKPGESLEFACALPSLTAFYAFHLEAEEAGIELRFVLSLPIDGVPEEREGAIFRSVLADRERFVRYLLLLLGTFDDPWAAQKFAMRARSDGRFGTDDIPLLEEMVRALCRDPARLGMVKRVVERLLEDPDSDQVIPPRFIELWDVIEREVEESAEA